RSSSDLISTITPRDSNVPFMGSNPCFWPLERCRSGGGSGSRTPLTGFADQCLAARPTHHASRRHCAPPALAVISTAGLAVAARLGDELQDVRNLDLTESLLHGHVLEMEKSAGLEPARRRRLAPLRTGALPVR